MTEPTLPTELAVSASERRIQSSKRAFDLFSGARGLIGDEIAFARDDRPYDRLSSQPAYIADHIG